LKTVSTDHDAFREAESAAKEKYEKLLAVKGNKTVKEFHQQLGTIVWDYIGMSRNPKV